jgi:DNA helicase II / ATP-dependent DNA helicase PcrA
MVELLTFSRRAAAEMMRRVERIVANVMHERAEAMTDAIVWAGTFHAVGARLLREYADAIGLERAFTIHDREDSADLMNLVRHDLGFSKTKKRFPMKGTCLAIYSRTVNAELPLEDVLGSFFPWCEAWEAELRRLFAAYVEAKQQQHVLDYDDLLLYWAQMMQEPSIAVDVSDRFDHVLVDEYQDTNRLQASVLLALKPNGRGLTVERYSAQRPQLVSVRDEADQARYVVEKVLENREAGLALKSQAILFRASHHSGPLEVELTRRNIPFVKFGGLKFLEAAHIKDLLAFLRWAENPRDRVAGFRVIQLLPGAGPATAARVLDRVAEQSDPMRGLSEFTPPAAAAEYWPSFVDAVQLVHGKSAGWPAELDLVSRWYAPHLERIHEDAAVRQRDLVQLGQIASGYSSRERFLTELTLDPPDSTSDQAGVPRLDEDYLILSTIHSAKGQEWKSVFLLNTVDGCLPSDLATGTIAEIEEERRLLYVAMTRAKDNLHLIVPQRFFAHSQQSNGDRHMYASRTRFIPDDIFGNFQGCAWPIAAVPAKEQKPPSDPIDISARLRRMWKA